MLWSTPGWLPEEIGIIVERGQFYCYEGEDLKLHIQRGFHNITVYSLIGMAVNIESGSAQKSHLVSMINGRSSQAHTPNRYTRTDRLQFLMPNRIRPATVNGTYSMTSLSVQSAQTKLSHLTRRGKLPLL
jgi:hypothetical protein